MNFEMAYESALPWEHYQHDGRLFLPRTRAQSLFAAAQSALALDGEFWECGVYKGGSARLLVELLRTSPRTLRLFDTFKGFAGVTEQDGQAAWPGKMNYRTDAIVDIEQFLGADFVRFHPGAIPEGFQNLDRSRIAFANLDVDLYQPTRDALAFILPRMVAGGVIVVDDYNDPDWPGVAKAVDELGVGFDLRVEGTQARIRT